MYRKYLHLAFMLVSCCLLLLLAACSPFGSSTNNSTPTATGTTPTATTAGTTPTPTTATVPATQTDCPAAGTARAAIIAPLVLGKDQNVVYAFNQGSSPGATSGLLRRYDVVTGVKTDILNISNSNIFEAQLSTDTQWVIFTAKVSGKTALQMVRVDGQGLQTLHCSASNLFGIQLSPDMKSVIFQEGSDLSAATVDLLDITTGKLQVEIVAPSVPGIGFSAATWLDNTHVYMTSFIPNSGAPPQSLYLLDTTKGANQHASDLQKIFDSTGFCLSFDSSVDSTLLYISKCNASFAPGANPTQEGPSRMVVEPALGGNQNTFYTNPTLAISAVRVISASTLLLVVQNLSGDTSNNGLWKINTDGTNLTRLTTTGVGKTTALNEYSQYLFSNISHDNSMYVIKISDSTGTSQSLLTGSLNIASSTTFASFSGNGNIYMVGWTRL